MLDFPQGIVRTGIFAQAPRDEHEYTTVRGDEEEEGDGDEDEDHEMVRGDAEEMEASSPLQVRSEDYAHTKEVDREDLELGRRWTS